MTTCTRSRTPIFVMILPMSVVAKGNGNGKNLPAQASEKGKPEARVKPENVPNKSARALLVAARNAWAKDEAGIPPGHANLIYKYILEEGSYEVPTIADSDAFKAMVSGFMTEKALTDIDALMEVIRAAKALEEAEEEAEVEDDES